MPPTSELADSQVSGRTSVNFAAIAKCDGRAIQWAGILSPQSIVAGIGGAVLAGTTEPLCGW